MTSLLIVSVPGDPVAKGRPRVVRMPSGFSRAFTPEKTMSWEAEAADRFAAAWQRPPMDGPLMLVVRAVKSRPKSLIPKPAGSLSSKRLAQNPQLAEHIWRQTKPDGDNVLKCVGDALIKSGVIRDDVDIVEWRIQCLYAALDQGPCVHVELWSVAEYPEQQ